MLATLDNFTTRHETYTNFTGKCNKSTGLTYIDWVILVFPELGESLVDQQYFKL